MNLIRRIKLQVRRIQHACIQLIANRQLNAATSFKAKNEKIKVGFIVQMPEIWDKEAPVFEKMVESELFDPYLIVVPSYDFANSTISEYGKELEFFAEKYPPQCIIKSYFKSDWLDLSTLRFDYIFYQRCYEHYLPEVYHTSQVIKHTKTCYIPYFYHGLNEDERYYYNHFFDSLYMFFCCSKQQLINQKSSKYKKNVFLGYPAIENIEMSNVQEYKTVLWTPRWTDDKETGGSTFFKYMNCISQLKESIPDIQLTLRPHPLAFSNAIRLGIMTEKEVKDYKSKVLAAGISFDDNPSIEDTFENTDILITDFSSILVPFILKGKPIIYCSNTDVDFSETFKKIIDCSYLAKCFEDVERYVYELRRGIDPLKEKRIKLAEDIKKDNINSTGKVLDYILADANVQ